jgi:outer membrane biosynthesis protein TonB
MNSLGMGLDVAAMKAVQDWVYRPTMLNGEPVEVVTTVEVNFMPNGQ